MEPIRAAVDVAAGPERAFELFTREMDSWWPREFSWSQELLDEVGMEPREGGFLYERGPYGFRCDWGRITAWDPPQRVRFTWQIAADRSPQPNPDKASEVEVTFTESQGDTHVEVEHGAWERHGDGAREYRDAFEQAGAWRHALERFAAVAQNAS